MKASRIAITVVVLLAIYGIGYTITHREKTYADAAQAEAKAQEPEIAECKAQLTALRQAWLDYKKDHKGGDPKIEDLVKYLKNPDMLVCPTARRWAKLGKPLDSGSIEVDRRSYSPTYGFMWTTPSGAQDFRKKGDKADLIRCLSHGEALYMAGYKRRMRVDAFAEENRPKLIQEVANAKELVILRNGTVEERPAGTD